MKEYGDDFYVKIDVTKVNNITHDDADRETYMFANLLIEGKGKQVKIVNLSCLAIGNGKVNSDTIAIDSIGHVVRTGYEAVDNRIALGVYWVFKGHIDIEDIKSLRLLLSPEQVSSCVDFAESQ